MRNIVDGKLVVDLFDLFEHLTAEQCAKVADAMSCAPAVMENVARQILDGWTEMSSHAATGCGFEPSTPLDRAVDEVARRSGEVAVHRLDELRRRGKRYEENWKEELSKRVDLEREVSELRLELRVARGNASGVL